MSDSELAEQLGRLSRSAPADPGLSLLNPLCSDANQLRNQRVDPSCPPLPQLEQLLREDSRFGKWLEGNARYSPQTGGSFRLVDLAHWALAQSKLRPPSEVIAHLAAFIETNSVEMDEIVALWGMHPTTEVDFGNGIRLVPLRSLKQSPMLDRLTGIKDVNVSTMDGYPSVPRPKAALVHTFVHQPVLVPLGTSTVESPSIKQKLSEVASVLPLIAERAVCEIAHWYQCSVETPLAGGKANWGAHAAEHVFHMEIEPTEFDPKEILSLVQKFLAMEPKLRATIRFAIEHLNTAMKSLGPANRAIYLGMALEAVLTAENEQDAPIAYRLRQRGAALLGTDCAEKRSLFFRLKTVYELRSRAAHGTALDIKTKLQGQSVDTRTFLRDCEVMVAKLLKRLIDLGKIPDWDGFILGW